jgi:uncharacterized membrane protein YdjX (TVP38/TMEM64 family)
VFAPVVAITDVVVSAGMNRKVAVLAAVAAVVAAGVVLGGYGWATGDGNVENLLTDTGVVGPLIFVLVMWSTQPLGVPGVVYMVPAGIVWPYPLAIGLSWIGNLGASYLAFAFARWFGRDWVQLRIPKRMYPYNDRLVAGGVWPIILLRLVFGQLAPADWLLGVSKVSTRNFLIGTAIGIVPGVVLFVVAGGGLFDALAGTSTQTRRIVIAVVVAVVVGRRLWLRRRSSQREFGATDLGE